MKLHSQARPDATGAHTATAALLLPSLPFWPCPTRENGLRQELPPLVLPILIEALLLGFEAHQTRCLLVRSTLWQQLDMFW
jgi:hypothetical protein